jgi:hypothetical protein
MARSRGRHQSFPREGSRFGSHQSYMGPRDVKSVAGSLHILLVRLDLSMTFYDVLMTNPPGLPL